MKLGSTAPGGSNQQFATTKHEADMRCCGVCSMYESRDGCRWSLGLKPQSWVDAGKGYNKADMTGYM